MEEDHPRSRGDNTGNSVRFLSVSGSPPLTRGQRKPRQRAGRKAGITPAHAGTTVKDPNNYAIFYLLDPVFIHFSKL